MTAEKTKATLLFGCKLANLFGKQRKFNRTANMLKCARVPEGACGQHEENARDTEIVLV